MPHSQGPARIYKRSFHIGGVTAFPTQLQLHVFKETLQLHIFKGTLLAYKAYTIVLHYQPWN